MNFDRYPVEENEEEIKIRTFIPKNLSQPLEETRLEQSLECNVLQILYVL